MSRYAPAFDIRDTTSPLFPDMFRWPGVPADTAPRSQVKSKHACRKETCEHGPSTGHRIVNGYCKEHEIPNGPVCFGEEHRD